MCGIFAYLSDIKCAEKIKQCFNKLIHRGPDNSILFGYNNFVYGFHRLSINGLDCKSNQPLYLSDNLFLLANAEIYNCKELAKKYDITLFSESDCEIILHLYVKFGIEKTVSLLDGVFSFIIVDHYNNNEEGKLIVARDPIGVRPLFVGKLENNKYCFASEAKILLELTDDIKQFQPGCYSILNNDTETINQISYCNNIYPVEDLNINLYMKDSIITKDIYNVHNVDYLTVINYIKYLLESAVNKRLLSNREIGCFLSGGFDSSIITSIVSNSYPNLQTFSIGLKGHHSPDLEAAEIVAKFLNTNHHRVEYTIEEGISAIKDVIYTLESYDVTTIRASTPQYLLSKYVKENTNVTVLLSGEGADEICGYQYLKQAPSEEEFIKETTKMLKELYQFDVLRTDRTTSKWSLEVRVPFLDKTFIQFMMSINPKYKMCKDTIEKKIFRDAFDNGEYLPDEILWRNKNAFSDAVSYSWVDELREHINNEITDDEYDTHRLKYTHNMPYDKESYYYRKIFEEKFKGHGAFIDHFWKPNQEWFKEEIKDPSARILNCFNDGDDYSGKELDNHGLNSDNVADNAVLL